MFYNENSYFLLCSCTDLVFGKMFVSTIWAKMFSASQIIGFFLPTIPSEQITELAWAFACWYKFTLKVDQKFFGWAWSKVFDYISRMKRWSELIAYWCKFRKGKSYSNDFWVSVVKKQAWPFSSWDPEICCVLRISLYELSWFFACWLWYTNFWLV